MTTEEYVRAVVDAWPPLKPEQEAHLAALLLGPPREDQNAA